MKQAHEVLEEKAVEDVRNVEGGTKVGKGRRPRCGLGH